MRALGSLRHTVQQSPQKESFFLGKSYGIDGNRSSRGHGTSFEPIMEPRGGVGMPGLVRLGSCWTSQYIVSSLKMHGIWVGRELISKQVWNAIPRRRRKGFSEQGLWLMSSLGPSCQVPSSSVFLCCSNTSTIFHHSCELCQHTGVERQRHKVRCGDGGQFQISDLPFTSPLTIGSVLNLSKAPLPYMWKGVCGLSEDQAHTAVDGWSQQVLSTVPRKQWVLSHCHPSYHLLPVLGFLGTL